jgi:DNA-directed RNA polymerase specialized sigma24 family protein
MSATQSVRCIEPEELDASVRKETLDETRASALEAMLQRLARRFEAKPASCSGLQQETLIALWLCVGRAEHRVSLQTWLHSVAEGVRVQQVIANRAENVLLGRSRGGVADGPLLLPDQEVALAIRMRVTLLHALLDSFRPRERDAALLDLQLFEPEHIAEKLRCSAAQARHLLVMAQRRLQLWVQQKQISIDRAPVSLVRVSDE